MNSSLFLPLILVLLFVPLLLSGRKQKRQMQQMQQLQSSLTEGDVVNTTSGLRGTVADASYEDTIDLEIAPGVVTTWLRAAVRDKVNPDTPGDETADDTATGHTGHGPGDEPGEDGHPATGVPAAGGDGATSSGSPTVGSSNGGTTPGDPTKPETPGTTGDAAGNGSTTGRGGA